MGPVGKRKTIRKGKVGGAILDDGKRAAFGHGGAAAGDQGGGRLRDRGKKKKLHGREAAVRSVEMENPVGQEGVHLTARGPKQGGLAGNRLFPLCGRGGRRRPSQGTRPLPSGFGNQAKKARECGEDFCSPERVQKKQKTNRNGSPTTGGAWGTTGPFPGRAIGGGVWGVGQNVAAGEGTRGERGAVDLRKK